MAAKHILIIDDDPEILGAMELILEAHGYSVDTAINTQEGLAKYEKTRPDLLILDIMMDTKTEGLVFAERIKAKEGVFGMPILIISGDPTAPSFESTYEKSQVKDMDWINADIYMEKPINPEGLLHNVEILIGKA